MKYQPHDYQKYATQFIIDHPVAAILLQMGLGKSVITLTAIQQVIDELSSFKNHQAKRFKSLMKQRHRVRRVVGLTYSVAVGTEAERRAALMLDVPIHIINRENVQWLIGH